MTREEHLNKIAAKCRELLAVAEKRSPGKWKNTKGKHGTIIRRATEKVGEPQDVCRVWNCSRLDGNATFIASCAEAAEAGWRATIAAIEQARQVIACYEAARIEGLNERLCESQYEPGTLRDLVERRLSYGETEAINLLDSIIAAWPEELL